MRSKSDLSLSRVLIIALALMTLTSFENFGATAVQNSEQDHNPCCLKQWIQTETGDYFNEEWLCYQWTETCRYGCIISCDCGVKWQCGNDIIFTSVGCRNFGRSAAGLTRCNDADPEQSFGFPEGCSSAAMAQGHPSACWLGSCSNQTYIQDGCNLFCPPQEPQ